MLREGNEHEDHTSGTSQKVAHNQVVESCSSLPLTVDTPKSPYSQRENQSNQNGNKWRANTKFGLEIFGVVLLTAYTVFSCLQWLQIRYTNALTARALDGSDYSLRQTLAKLQLQVDAANATNKETQTLALQAQRSADAAVSSYEDTARPYILPKMESQVKDNPTVLNFVIFFKNYGNIPAQRVEDEWMLVINGSPNRGTKEQAEPDELAPGENLQMVGQIGTDDAPRVISGRVPLLIYAKYSYRWRTHKDQGCYKYKYYPFAHTFISLGPVCYPK